MSACLPVMRPVLQKVWDLAVCLWPQRRSGRTDQYVPWQRTWLSARHTTYNAEDETYSLQNIPLESRIEHPTSKSVTEDTGSTLRSSTKLEIERQGSFDVQSV